VKLIIKSSSFEDGGMIPKKHTCQGGDISPQIDISGIPENALSLAIICDDPDAPSKVWVHWVIFNIPPNTRTLPEGLPTDKTLKDGSIQGINDSGSIGYDGPCPPSGVHRYYFKVYALDAMLSLTSDTTKNKLLEAMKGHVIAEGQLMGKFTKN
jgi:Raf kinase inhibitor-like YbhB/YbcL family protein